jgi:hypothetical protein
MTSFFIAISDYFKRIALADICLHDFVLIYSFLGTIDDFLRLGQLRLTFQITNFLNSWYLALCIDCANYN